MPENLKALMYETQYKDYSPDFLMYETLLDKNIPVIEFGSGTGRITQHLLKSGYKVYGIEKDKSYREYFSQKIADKYFKNRFSFLSDITNAPEICNIIYPFNVLFHLDENHVINEIAKFEGHFWNKIIIEIDNIIYIDKDSFQTKTHNSLGYLFKEYFVRKPSHLVIKNQVIRDSKIILQFDYPLFFHKAKFILKLFERLFYHKKLYGDFKLNPYTKNSPKLVIVLSRSEDIKINP